ncbi:MAG TPA: M43 family zinc metalloprotease [Ohtaekwangia sp.]|nr:M43 family zinc metalloprotease [Ohtaekwangia sp.]
MKTFCSQTLYSLALVFIAFNAIAQKDCGFKLSEEEKINFIQSLRTGAFDKHEVDFEDFEVQVVFHVLYDEDNENVSDEAILKELSDLNRDFQLLNDDTSRLSGAFKKLVGNPNIRFRLAAIDPKGNPTNGIIRRRADRRKYTFGKPIFHADPIWNSELYMNVYIGNIRNGKTRGYVNSLPWQARSTDAIALYFGDIGDGTRLLSHEAGHWFGLWHIIEGGCGETNDGIEDTPRQKTFTNNCPTSKSECGNDCFTMNYMDYSDCRVAFSKGQVARMREIIQMHRWMLNEPPL